MDRPAPSPHAPSPHPQLPAPRTSPDSHASKPHERPSSRPNAPPVLSKPQPYIDSSAAIPPAPATIRRCMLLPRPNPLRQQTPMAHHISTPARLEAFSDGVIA